MAEYVRKDAEVVHAVLYDGDNADEVHQLIIDNVSAGREVKTIQKGQYLQVIGLDRFQIVEATAFEAVYTPAPAPHAHEGHA